MENEKIENLLNLALSVDEEERMRSPELSVGYEPTENTWEVIVRYFGELSGLRLSYPHWQITELLGGYAVIRLPQGQVDTLAALEQIQYVEKPKQLYFEVAQGRRSSCMLPVQTGRGDETDLTGAGVLVAVIDSGIDYLHPDFVQEDGGSRIVALWDQTAQPKNDEERPPVGYSVGVEYTRAQIDRALAAPDRAGALAIVPETDSGHGTHVAGIAAGNGRASNGVYRGVAYESELLVVKLGTPGNGSFPRTTELMTGVDYCLRKAASLGKPLAMNLSFGNNYGSHSGTSLIETYLNAAAGYGKCSIVAGSGNEGAKPAHTSGILVNTVETIELAVSDYESSLNIQLWKSYVDQFSVELIHPDGKSRHTLSGSGSSSFTLGATTVLVYEGVPSPYSPYQEIYLELLGQPYVDAGIWQLGLTPVTIREGNYDLWLPAGAALNSGTGFLRPTVDTTLTIPGTASGILTVGAYDTYTDAMASFSGRGYTWALNQVKPDLVAPGVDIVSCAPGGGYVSRSGTSMATPFVTGAAALLMQWGIVSGRDPYLYGEKLRAYLHRGARPLPGFNAYPNPQTGYGALCVGESLPV
jgi:subtilisin family serine protease